MLDHLRQDDAPEGLPARVAEHLGRLILADGDGLDAAAVDLGKIGRVVDDEADDERGERPARRELHAEDIIRCKAHHDQLQHERRAAQDGDEEANDILQGLEAGHAPEAHQQAQRQRQQQREREDQARGAKALEQLDADHGK